MQDPRGRHGVGVAKSANPQIRNPQSAIAIRNPQSAVTIDNRQSRSTIGNLKIRSLKSEISNRLCHKPPLATLYKSEHVSAGGHISLDPSGSGGGRGSHADSLIVVRPPRERAVSSRARDAARSRCGAGCRSGHVRTAHRASSRARRPHQFSRMAVHRSCPRMSRSTTPTRPMASLDKRTRHAQRV